MNDAPNTSINRSRHLAAMALGLGLTGTTLWTTLFGGLSEFLLRGVVLWAAGIAVLLLQPTRTGPRWAGAALDLVIGAAFSAAIFWFLRLSEELWSGLYILSGTDQLLALTGLLSLLELTRRAIGTPLAILAGLCVVYALFGDSLPWIFRHAGYSLSSVSQTVWYSLDGVFGIAAAVMVSLVFVYIVFGSVLECTGAGEVMLRVATRSTEGFRGGAGHGAVAASALFGTISGSVTANVVGTGVFTMGLMKRQGFRPAFAGGVEASASAAGQFLPPVMGAAAFLMSELVGVSYLTICLAALLPALFFFASLFLGVRLEAVKQGMAPVPRSQRQPLSGHDMRQSLLFIVPIGTILAVLISGRSPALAGVAAIGAAVVLGLLLSPELRRNPQRLLAGLANGGLAGARIMVAVGAIGILIGVLNLTGLGTRIAETILSFGGDSLLPSLILTMIASIVLGMGLPTLPAYLLIVILVGPALERLGVPLLAAHLFVMYFAVFSALTPPVALAAFAAAPIVGAPPTRIGLAAMRLSAAGFIIPFAFVYDPALLIVFAQGPLDTLLAGLGLAAAIWLIATALAGIDARPLPPAARGLRLVAAMALLLDIQGALLLGVALGIACLAHDRRRKVVQG
ncbi:TRAP transporter permease [Oceanibium sediminis]|uniref:TRAP transporter permease n=1 Tax=Oceanibium sediminis TaxID=2026339 RepID=UPI000DD2D988|nr:TRAP transporter fused permease subunit [Oceanibium sediminis]